MTTKAKVNESFRRRKNAVYSLKLRCGKYALIQLLDNHGIIIFNTFRDDENWTDADLSKDSVLIAVVLAKKSLKKCPLTRQAVSPVLDYDFPDTVIASSKFRYEDHVFWEGTEIEVLKKNLRLTGKLEVYRKYRVKGKSIEERRPLERCDYDSVESLEMGALRLYPEFQERLNICAMLGKNYDPLKEIGFDRKLDPACVAYIEMMAGSVPITHYGY